MPATKRKSDAIDLTEEEPNAFDILKDSQKVNKSAKTPAAKKARVDKDDEDFDAGDEEIKVTEKAKPKGKAKKPAEKMDWKEIKLPGEDEGEVAIYDDCNDIRRKIRALQKTPGFKITHWLRDIGDVNSNSYNRFMKLSGPQGGAENSTYEAAYIYFEKVRIAENKKKTAKREANEREWTGGLPQEGSHRRRYIWVKSF